MTPCVICWRGEEGRRRAGLEHLFFCNLRYPSCMAFEHIFFSAYSSTACNFLSIGTRNAIQHVPACCLLDDVLHRTLRSVRTKWGFHTGTMAVSSEL